MLPFPEPEPDGGMLVKVLAEESVKELMQTKLEQEQGLVPVLMVLKMVTPA